MLAKTKTVQPNVINGINVDALHVLIEGVRSVGSVLFETGLLSPPIADIGADIGALVPAGSLGAEASSVNARATSIRTIFALVSRPFAFGIASAEKIQKKQLDTQEAMLEQLQGIHGKVGKPVFE